MNNKIYRLVQFYLYDHTGIQRYLEKMAAKGWYPTEQVEQQKIDKVKQKFSSSMQ